MIFYLLNAFLYNFNIKKKKCCAFHCLFCFCMMRIWCLHLGATLSSLPPVLFFVLSPSLSLYLHTEVAMHLQSEG